MIIKLLNLFKFICILEAEKTVESLQGRYFAGRMVKAELYDQTAYQADDLSG